MKAFRMSREELHALGARPDGKGGVVRLPASEWAERHRTSQDVPAVATKPAPAIRIPARRRPNATEEAWFLEARAKWPDVQIRYEAISFRLNSGALYTPDFSGWVDGRLVWVCEVKGKFLGHSSRSILAWKTAASEWPQVLFIFAQRKGGLWRETSIKPR